MPINSWNSADATGGTTLSNGNLTVTYTGLTGGIRTVGHAASGKCYWEYTFTLVSGVTSCGMATLAATLGYNPAAGAAMVASQGSINTNGTTPAVLPAFNTGNVCCIALDLDNQRFWAKNGAAGQWNNSGTANPATNTGGIAVAYVGAGVQAYGMTGNNFGQTSVITANFGDSAFTGAVPAGFTAGFPTGGASGGSTAQARAMVLA